VTNYISTIVDAVKYTDIWTSYCDYIKCMLCTTIDVHAFKNDNNTEDINEVNVSPYQFV
jgi:hypothetical protein